MLLIALFEYSFILFADFVETSEMLPLEAFKTLAVDKVKKNTLINKEKGEKWAVKPSSVKALKKLRTEEEDNFLLSISALTVLIRSDTRSYVLTHQIIEKLSKNKEDNDEVIQD